MSPTSLNTWVIYSSTDMYASYSLSDELSVTNNLTIIKGAFSIATISKYQPVSSLPFILRQISIGAYDI